MICHRLSEIDSKYTTYIAIHKKVTSLRKFVSFIFQCTDHRQPLCV